ncbi:MAG TPA: four helix bundle protein [Vicinamibacterales bacterium]|jgi:four helix bundle protein
MTLPHHSLVVWQRADDLFIDLHKLTLKAFPSFERYELGPQTRRAAYSVAANVVERSAREHKREKLQFLNTSRSSLAEVGYCVHVAKRLGYINEVRFRELELSIRGVGGALAGYVRAAKVGRTI